MLTYPGAAPGAPYQQQPGGAPAGYPPGPGGHAGYPQQQSYNGM